MRLFENRAGGRSKHRRGGRKGRKRGQQRGGANVEEEKRTLKEQIGLRGDWCNITRQKKKKGKGGQEKK